MTAKERNTSLKNLYKTLMFPKSPYATKWTMAEIDEMDVHFFYDLMDGTEETEVKRYINDVFG